MSVPRILVVFNTCGIRRENPLGYIQGLQTILDQDYLAKDVVVSSCLNSDQCLESLRQHFGEAIKIIRVLDRVPINITFNNALQTFDRMTGPYAGFLYVDSGIQLTSPTALSKMVSVLTRPDVGLVSLHTDTDSGGDFWTPDLAEDINQIFPGFCMNLHTFLFHRDLFEYYTHRIMADVYASYGTEPSFAFMCAGIQKKWFHVMTPTCKHLRMMDGPSSLFEPWQCNIWHTFSTSRTVQDIVAKGWEYGFGREISGSNRAVFEFDQSKFDAQGFALDPRLKEFLRDNIFLQPHEFNYFNLTSELL